MGGGIILTPDILLVVIMLLFTLAVQQSFFAVLLRAIFNEITNVDKINAFTKNVFVIVKRL